MSQNTNKAIKPAPSKRRYKHQPWPPALVFNLFLFWGGLVSLGLLAAILGPSYWLSVPSTVIGVALIPGVKNAWNAVA
jgi:hypothetical protein